MKVYIVKTDVQNAAEKTAELFEAQYAAETGVRIKYRDLPRSDAGKPRLPENKKQFPDFTAGRQFSITHSGEFWCMAVAKEPVGTDLEKRREMLPRVIKRVMAPEEKAINGYFLNNFVIKEAYSKLVGEGLGIEFRKFDASELIKKYRSVDKSTNDYIWWILLGSNQ